MSVSAGIAEDAGSASCPAATRVTVRCLLLYRRKLKARGFDASLSSSARNGGKAALLQGWFPNEGEVSSSMCKKYPPPPASCAGTGVLQNIPPVTGGEGWVCTGRETPVGAANLLVLHFSITPAVSQEYHQD